MFLDWFRADLRNGWLGDHPRRNPNSSRPRTSNEYIVKVRARREKHALDLPYGPAAYRHGLAPDDRPPPKAAGADPPNAD